jgi:hypothetical protein
MCAGTALVNEGSCVKLELRIVQVVQLVYSWCYWIVEWQGVS